MSVLLELSYWQSKIVKNMYALCPNVILTSPACSTTICTLLRVRLVQALALLMALAVNFHFSVLSLAGTLYLSFSLPLILSLFFYLHIVSTLFLCYWGVPVSAAGMIWLCHCGGRWQRSSGSGPQRIAPPCPRGKSPLPGPARPAGSHSWGPPGWWPCEGSQQRGEAGPAWGPGPGLVGCWSAGAPRLGSGVQRSVRREEA